MKLLLTILLLASAANAATVKLAWDAMPGCSYRLYSGSVSGKYSSTNSFNTNAATLTVDLPRYFVVTAITSNKLESMFSSEVCASNATVVLIVERSTNMKVWQPLSKSTQTVVGDVGFWRVKVE